SSRSRSLGSRGPRISSAEAIRMLIWSKFELLGSRPLRKSIIVSLLPFGGYAEGDLEPESLQFLDQHVERLGDPRLREVLPLDNRLVHPAATVHVVRLDRQHLLQHVRGAVCLERPHFH